MQGAGAPTMFQAMRRIVDCLSQERMTEDSFERTLRSSFLGIPLAILFYLEAQLHILSKANLILHQRLFILFQ